MKKNIRHDEGFSPDSSERTEDYWNGNRSEEDLPWHARKTGRLKSKSRGKPRNEPHPPQPETQDEVSMGDSDLE